MKKILLVCYGSGHVAMVLPVAQALAARGDVSPVILALTTAAPVVKSSGLAMLQFKDFVTAQDASALAHGQRLLASLDSPPADAQESAAYLGLCFADLVDSVGLEQAQALYDLKGRQAFLPVRMLGRILRQIKPDLVIATNSPRAERAAIVAAGTLGIASVCMVDLFAVDEVQWIGEPHYASQVCVLNDSVKDFLVCAGRSPEQVSVTGNPAFDALADPSLPLQAQQLQQRQGWQGKRVIVWPSQQEPAYHPFNGQAGHPELPATALACLLQWVLTRTDCVLCIRPRAGEPAPAVPDDPRIVITGQDWPLPSLLAAAHLVVTLSSTVGLQGHLLGTRLIQVLGSVFDEAMPLLRYGVADEAVSVQGLIPALERQVAQPRHDAKLRETATQKVLTVVDRLLYSNPHDVGFAA